MDSDESMEPSVRGKREVPPFTNARKPLKAPLAQDKKKPAEGLTGQITIPR